MTLLTTLGDIKKELVGMVRERRVSDKIGNLFLILISLLWTQLKSVVWALTQQTKKRLGKVLPSPI
jgi:hypothetical protein